MPDVGERSPFQVILFFGNLRAIDASDRIGYGLFDALQPEKLQGASGVNAKVTLGGAVATFTDSVEYKGKDAISFGGKKVGKVWIYLTFCAKGLYSPATSASIKINATTTKVEILDGVTVKATYTHPTDHSSDTATDTHRNVVTVPVILLDLADFVFTDFRIKVTISSTVSTTTNLSNNKHYYLGTFNDEVVASDADGNAGVCWVEVI